VSAADVLTAVGASQAYRLTSLNAPYTGTGGDDLIEFIGGIDPHYTGVDDHLLLPPLRPLLAALPMRERRILTMRFFGNMSQAQIADKVGASARSRHRGLGEPACPARRRGRDATTVAIVRAEPGGPVRL
jgi:RNA polymerase sigma-B factor